MGHTCIKLSSYKQYFPPRIVLNLIACFPLAFSSLTLSNFFQAAETPKPRDVESPKDSGVRKRKGGQANVIGQVMKSVNDMTFFKFSAKYRGTH